MTSQKNMKKIFLNRKIQKLFLPLALVFVVPAWLMVRSDASSPLVYPLLILAMVFFVLDRAFKPRTMEKLEKEQAHEQKMLTDNTFNR